jgi:parallel beta-helix repeat protein
MKIILLLLVLGMIVPVSAAATDYYVAKTDCSDSYPGNLSQPWCTIQKAANMMVAGDTVYIREGTYYEIVQHTATSSNSGTPGNYITYKVYQNENVTIDAQNDWVTFIVYNRDYIKIDGSGTDGDIHLFIKNADRVLQLRAADYCWVTHIDASGSPYNDGLKLASDAPDTQSGGSDDNSGSKHCIVEYSRFHSNGDYGIKLTGWNTSYNIIRYNLFYDNGATGADGYGMQVSGGYYVANQPKYNEIYGNEFYYNYDSGIHLFESSYNRIWGNKFYNNGRNGDGRGVSLSTNSNYNEIFRNEIYNNSYYGAESYGSHSNRFYNNVIYNNTREGIMIQNGATNNEIYHNTIHGGRNGGIYLSASTSGTIIKDNIIYTNGRQSALNNGGAGTAISDYNLWYDTTTARPIYWNSASKTVAEFFADTGNDEHSVQQNPLFADVNNYDFHLQPESSARDNGTNAGITDDFDENARPQGYEWDMGAYEYTEPTNEWFISKNGDNSDGMSWSTAWNEMEKIDWAAVQPGDTIYIDGGPSGMAYTTTLAVGKGGNEGQRIFIQRSEDAGHDGKVTIGYISVGYPYITIDGKDRNKFEIFPVTGYGVRVKDNSDGFELKNILVHGDFTGTWGSLFFADAGSVTISGCEFIGTNAEDQIKYRATDKFLTIENSYFHGLRARDNMTHADIVEGDADGYNLTVRRNIFYDSPIDCFMMADDDIDHAEFSYNVFSGVADAIKIHSAQNVEIYNNVFDECRDLILYVPSPATMKNNIFTGARDPVHVPEKGPEYCLWDVGTTEYEPGTGNSESNPLFADKNNPLGPDGVPFTTDDGYMLQSGSPAINAGIDIGFSFDIIGNSIIDVTDMGAYEFISGPYHRSDASTNGCVELNEMIAFMDRWKLSVTDVAMPEMMESISLWKSGTGCQP